jgi:hypothetical protein
VVSQQVMSPLRLPWEPSDDVDTRLRTSLGEPATRELLTLLTRPETERAALIGRLRLHRNTEWLAELMADLEEDDVARHDVVEELRRVS